MKTIIALICCLFSINVFAGVSAIVIAHETGNVPVNSAIDIDAEYVSMAVSLSSDAEYPSQRAQLVRKLHSAISQAASSNTNIDLRQGTISLSSEKNSSFSFSKSYSARSDASLFLLSKLDNNKDVYAATQEIYKFVGSIQKPEDTRLTLGYASLALSSPEQYRGRLLEMIRQEVEAAKTILGSSYKLSISGLENPVGIRQKNDRQVTVFIDYRFSLTEKS